VQGQVRTRCGATKTYNCNKTSRVVKATKRQTTATSRAKGEQPKQKTQCERRTKIRETSIGNWQNIDPNPRKIDEKSFLGGFWRLKPCRGGSRSLRVRTGTRSARPTDAKLDRLGRQVGHLGRNFGHLGRIVGSPGRSKRPSEPSQSALRMRV